MLLTIPIPVTISLGFDYYPGYIDTDVDWYYSYFWLGLYTLPGLVFYCAIVCFLSFKNKLTIEHNNKYFWREGSRVSIILVVTMFLSFVAQFYIYKTSGGILNYMSLYTNREEIDIGNLALLYMLADFFPTVLLFALIYFNKSKKRNLLYASIMLVLLFLAKLYFGGLRGSRSNTIWYMLQVIIIIHVFLRQFKKKELVILFIFGAVFMSTYAVYKRYGVNSLDINNYSEVDNSLLRTLTLDMSRTSMQAYLIHREAKQEQNYAMGVTYLGAINMIVPRFISNDRIHTKTFYGTEFMYGNGSFLEHQFRSSRIFGLIGEGILNFSASGVFISIIIYGLFVVFISDLFCSSIKNKDFRMIIYPSILVFAFAITTSDSDNTVFYFLKNIIPLLLLYKFTIYKKQCK